MIPRDLSAETSSSNEVCEDYHGNPLNGNEEGVQMPSTPSPRCIPVVIYSSSDDDESVYAGFLQMMTVVNQCMQIHQFNPNIVIL